MSKFDWISSSLNKQTNLDVNYVHVFVTDKLAINNTLIHGPLLTVWWQLFSQRITD